MSAESIEKYKRGSRTLISWFVSYIAVICVPILPQLLYVFLCWKDPFRTDSTDAGGQCKTNWKSVCDGKMEKIHVIGRQIAENPDITGFMEYETTQSGESKLAIQSVFKYLQAQMANENCIN